MVEISNEPLQDKHIEARRSSGGNESNELVGQRIPMKKMVSSSQSRTRCKKKILSIYDAYSHSQRRLILGIVSLVAGLLPFCDTIYLPVLRLIEKDLETSEILVNTSVSIYLFMNGLGALVWGPLSDRYGRKRMLLISLVAFVVSSIVCIFAANISMLLVFRAIQGATVAVTLVTGQGVIADIYPAARRGWATGIFFVPLLVGPVIGPLVGGALAARFGWRSTFVLLSVLSFIITAIILFFLPETQQYLFKKRFEQRHRRTTIVGEDEIQKRSFQKPWIAIQFLIKKTIAPYATVATVTFAGLFISLTLFGGYLSDKPYEKDETIIGVLFVPAGVAMLIGSVLGGWLSDKAGVYFTPELPEGRLVPAIAFSFFTPIGLLIYGWGFHYRLNLSVSIIGQIMLGFGQSVHQPGVFAYLTAKKPKDAAAVSAANSMLNFCGAAVGVTIATPLEKALGIGGFYCLISGINLVAIILAGGLVYRAVRSYKPSRIDIEKRTRKENDSIFKISGETNNVNNCESF